MEASGHRDREKQKALLGAALGSKPPPSFCSSSAVLFSFSFVPVTMPAHLIFVTHFCPPKPKQTKFRKGEVTCPKLDAR